jgi:hypothetical protein
MQRLRWKTEVNKEWEMKEVKSEENEEIKQQNKMKTRREIETVVEGDKLDESKQQQLKGKPKVFEHVAAKPCHRKQINLGK